jgi:methylglutaconyl-CoA hydratase
VAIAACCDIVVAAEAAFFAITEVRLGMAPAPLMPYFVRALGNRAARRYVLTAERLPAVDALALGFVHRVVAQDDLDAALAELSEALLLGAPGALADSKALIASVDGQPIDAALLEQLEGRLEAARATDEAREGVASFREKRRPGWYPPPA